MSNRSRRHDAPQTGEPVRKCVASGARSGKRRLIRFVAAPDGAALPDLAEKLPGRGVWISARADAISKAVEKNLFSRALKRAVRADKELPDFVRDGLRRRCLEHLGRARRAGRLVTGFEKVRASLKNGDAVCLIEASDGAPDGRAKVFAADRAGVVVIGCFSSSELGLALGADNVVHSALSAGSTADRFLAEVERLEGFEPLAPPEWSQDAPAPMGGDSIESKTGTE